MSRFKHYKGWLVTGAGDQWGASRHGVDLSANSEANLERMIDLKSLDDPYTNHTKSSPSRRIIEAATEPRKSDGTPNPPGSVSKGA